MVTTSESLAFDRGVRPVLEIVLPEKADAVIGFRADSRHSRRDPTSNVAALNLNNEIALVVRRSWITAGWRPPGI